MRASQSATEPPPHTCEQLPAPARESSHSEGRRGWTLGPLGVAGSVTPLACLGLERWGYFDASGIKNRLCCMRQVSGFAATSCQPSNKCQQRLR